MSWNWCLMMLFPPNTLTSHSHDLLLSPLTLTSHSHISHFGTYSEVLLLQFALSSFTLTSHSHNSHLALSLSHIVLMVYRTIETSIVLFCISGFTNMTYLFLTHTHNISVHIALMVWVHSSPPVHILQKKFTLWLYTSHLPNTYTTHVQSPPD